MLLWLPLIQDYKENHCKSRHERVTGSVRYASSDPPCMEVNALYELIWENPRSYIP